MALTRTDIIRYAKADLDEDGDTFWSATALEDYANRANRMVHREILKVNPGFFLSTTQYTWASGKVSEDIATILGDEPALMIDIEHTPSAGAIGSSNLPSLLTPMRFIERPMKYRSHWRSTSLVSSYSWELQGRTLFIARVPGQALNLHIHFVPQLANMGASDVVLGGFADPYHDAVASCLAYLMNMKQEGENPEVIRAWTQWKQDIAAMASRRRVDGPKHITVTRSR
ncbi:MAG: hypothetical protein CMM54_00655 [Rhodospirillaceae bacterium]|nr:hypothetical protein [Rhodospirillaceae bacterium]MBI05471.1 hypothetical protein [Rhodospirillaceae bacterium]|tara:strand:+ start:6070 stop:6753 length:684 start_codon:yes stop_codon:yes gene_type:complete